MRLWILLLPCLVVCASAQPAHWSERVKAVIRASWDDLTARVANQGGDRLTGIEPAPGVAEGRPQSLDTFKTFYPLSEADYWAVEPWFQLLDEQLKHITATQLSRTPKTRFKSLLLYAFLETRKPREAFYMVDRYLNLLFWRHMPTFGSAHMLARRLPPRLLPPEAHFRYDLLHRAAIEATELPRDFLLRDPSGLTPEEKQEYARLTQIRMHLADILRNGQRANQPVGHASLLDQRFEQAYDRLRTASGPETEGLELDDIVVDALIRSQEGVTNSYHTFNLYLDALAGSLRRELSSSAAQQPTRSAGRFRLFGVDLSTSPHGQG